MYEDLAAVQKRINGQESFVLNIVASWCPDCTEEQAPNLAGFAEQIKPLELVNLKVQEQKRVYLSEEHERFTKQLGGHGFPRTVLFLRGVAVDAENVEVLTADALRALAEHFLQQAANSGL